MTDHVYLFNYTECTVSKLILSPGVYRFEVWGASSLLTQSMGGYSSGYLRVRHPLPLFIHLGGMGDIGFGTVQGGCNGGGDAQTTSSNILSGGGGTDIRAYEDTLYHRFIVAGGGAGGGDNYYGGGEKGRENGGYGRGHAGNQTHPGIGCSFTNECNSGTFGFGGNGSKSLAGFGAGGGGGWYGGASGAKTDTNGWGGAGAGSGYVLNETSYKPPNYALRTEMYMFKTELLSGNVKFVTPDHSTEKVGNAGNGAARITFISPLFCATINRPFQHFCVISFIATFIIIK